VLIGVGGNNTLASLSEWQLLFINGISHKNEAISFLSGVSSATARTVAINTLIFVVRLARGEIVDGAKLGWGLRCTNSSIGRLGLRP